MIASMLNLSRTDCKVLELKDIYSLHKMIYSLFPEVPGQSRDFLFADKGGDFKGRKILILSEREPLSPEYGTLYSKPVPDHFLELDHYGFEIVMNPTKRDLKTGQIVSVRGEENLMKWFLQKAANFGFEVLPQSLQVSHAGVVTYQKKGETRTHNTATFTGKLKVTERSLFIRSFKEGMGRAKAFGFGLLQIVPVDHPIH